MLTAEELTARRREERKIFKLERAQAIQSAAADAEATFISEGRPRTPPPENISTTVRTNLATRQVLAQPSEWSPADSAPLAEMEATDSVMIEKISLPDGMDPPENMEHFQLTLQEALFLSWGLDCLLILEPITVSLYIRQCKPPDQTILCVSRNDTLQSRRPGMLFSRLTLTQYPNPSLSISALTILSSCIMSPIITSAPSVGL